MCRFKNKKGFSLIELMVVVAIMGILASIGIPQYIAYRDSTAWGRLDTELKSVRRAFSTCVSTKTFAQCNNLNELGLNDLDVGDASVNTSAFSENSTMTSFCADIVRDIGAFMAQACVDVDAFTFMENITINRQVCVDDGGAGTWDSVGMTGTGMFVANVATGMNCTGGTGGYACKATWDGTCAGDCGDTLNLNEPCTENTFCVGQGLDYCNPPGDTGECTAGECG